MSEPRQPVFLSYASEDAEAARRICEAMRAAGIEAWFDESELRGGDAWDQKIRRQIKDCVLFMPLISSTTNARAEGYFRLEWRLAVERSRLMADDAPFIVPVAIDASGEAEARVPDRFREVQWMWLGKDSPESIAARVGKLLAGESKAARVEAGKKGGRSPLRYVWAGIGVLVALVVIVKPLIQPKRDREQPATTAMPVSEPATLAQRAIAVTKTVNYTRESLAAAADHARKATDLDPSLAVAWGARARVEATWVLRVWDMSEDRRRATQEHARRALALDPEEPNALWSQGVVLNQQGATKEAEGLYRRALKASPDDNMIRRSLAGALTALGREKEGLAESQDAMRRDPRDPLNYYGPAQYYTFKAARDHDLSAVDPALLHWDRVLELEPLVTALTWKAHIQVAFKGDFEGANATLARLAALPLERATEERALFYRMWIPLLERQPARVLEVAALTTTNYFTDAFVQSPPSWLKAHAHKEAGRGSAAAEEWRAAETVLRARLAARPDDLLVQAQLAVTLAWLGRKDEATKQFARYDAAMRDRTSPAWLTHAHFYAAMGDAKRAVAAIRDTRKINAMWMTESILSRDPRFDLIRGHPEFKALLQEVARK